MISTSTNGTTSYDLNVDQRHDLNVDRWEASIDTLQAAPIDSVNQASNDIIHLVSDNTVHLGTVHLGTIHRGKLPLDTVHSDTIHREFPIPPDRSVHMGSYNGFFDDHMYAVASQRGLRSKGEVDKSPVEAASIDTRCVLEQKGFDVCGNRFEGDTTTGSDKYGGKKRKNWKKRKRIKGDPQLSLIPHFSDGVRKSRVRIRCFSQPFTKLQALLISKMIDK
ncbi:hypothetical protein F2Q69_00058914 [Brassica cretica]|uniref:Uncharacterized protein n=1 Tax=Brassica cretica TaxID=69181 RepID=A0A8S9RM45_BRACR|nr:hypothetical protein F2Q69_00058914 [Brassica cretica]